MKKNLKTSLACAVQDLADTFKGEEDHFELNDALEAVAEMVKAVNDSLHQVRISFFLWQAFKTNS